MYYVIGAAVTSLHRESTDSLIDHQSIIHEYGAAYTYDMDIRMHVGSYMLYIVIAAKSSKNCSST